MKRDRQIELMTSAEDRTVGHLKVWIARDPAVKEALQHQNRHRVEVVNTNAAPERLTARA